jgi:hypothetical protein
MEGQEPGTGGYPEENPPELDPSTTEGPGEGSDLDHEPLARETAAGEGTQSTGHPENAG